MQLTKKTSLEKTDDVADTLNWKVKTITKASLPIESGLADYIAFSVDNLQNEIDYLADLKKQISDKEKDLKSQIEYIKVEGAKFLTESGIERLDGNICSSVTIIAEKEAKDTEETKKVFTPLIPNEEIEELLIGLGKAELKNITTTKTSDFIPAKLKINKQKKKKEDVIDVEVDNAPTPS